MFKGQQERCFGRNKRNLIVFNREIHKWKREIQKMKKIGLVLTGGGGRGAYHIGVWKALTETKLDRYVSAVSGTSVGGLNAVLCNIGNAGYFSKGKG